MYSTVEQKVAPVCKYGMECPGEWKLFEGHCYLLVKKYVNWTEGEKDCKNQGAHLASIHSAAENSFIHSLAPSNNLWIGGTDAAVEVGFTIYVQTVEDPFNYTVKRPKFNILFGENIFFLQNLFR